jgi:hypothetical protein
LAKDGCNAHDHIAGRRQWVLLIRHADGAILSTSRASMAYKDDFSENQRIRR